MEAVSAQQVLNPGAETRPQKTRLGRKRIYILPTRYGLMFGGVLVLMLLGSVNYNNSLGYVLCFLLGSLSLVCLLHTYRNLAGITLDGGRVNPVFASQTAHFQLCFDNRDSHQRFSLNVQRRSKRSLRQLLLSRDEQTPDWQGELAARQMNNVPISIESEHRGILPLGVISLSSSFPLGLFRAWSLLETGLDCTVYPKPAGISELPFDRGAKQSGQTGTQEGVDDFTGFRDYYPGDSPKYIAWKSYARSQELLIKRFSGSGSEQVLLDWDNLFYLPDDEQRLSQLCLWVIEAETQGLRYCLNLPGQKIPYDLGQTQREKCLAALAVFRK